MDAVRTKLSEIEKQYKEIVEKLMDEKVMSDPKLLTKLSKEQARLTQPVDAYHQLLELDSRIAQADEMLKENDPELKEMARMEKDECEPEREALLERIQHLLVPRDPDDDHDVITTKSKPKNRWKCSSVQNTKATAAAGAQAWSANAMCGGVLIVP